MIRRDIVLAMAAMAALVGACTADTTTSPNTGNPPAETSTGTSGDAGDGPIDLEPIPAGEALDPGRYAVPLFGDDGPARALVDVPAGYFSAGGWVIDDGHGTLVPDEFGDLLFLAGEVDGVDSQPCRHGRLVLPGPSVRGLTRALVASAHARVTRPRPVTIDGHHGLSLVITAPAEIDSCTDGQFRLLLGPDVGWYGADMSRTRLHLWILDVDGLRIVAAARVIPGHTSHPSELVHMVATAEFVPDLRAEPTWTLPGDTPEDTELPAGS